MSHIMDDFVRIQNRHAQDCDRIVQAAKRAGIPVGYGACGNGGIPTFQAIVQRCVLAMDTHADLKRRNEEMAEVLQEARNELSFYDIHLENYHASADTRPIIDHIDAVLAKNGGDNG